MVSEIRSQKSETQNSLQGLDHAFLRWLPVVPEDQKLFQRFYLPMFEDCKMVVDLGCGEGNFLELLEEEGIDTVGVDFDRMCCESAWERGLNAVHQDALTYLAEAEAESVDGIFAAHLVEHLPYETVIELIQRSYRVLKPGGIIVLATPNVRGIYSHLEMFYIHFGHVTFYHPRLLCFFLEYAGFAEPEAGDNPSNPHPMCGDVLDNLRRMRVQQANATDGLPTVNPISYEPQLPKPLNPLRRLIWHGKMLLVKLIVQPYLDHFMTEINRSISETNRRLNAQKHRVDTTTDESLAQFIKMLERLDRPFEAYATARKPQRSESAAAQEKVDAATP